MAFSTPVPRSEESPGAKGCWIANCPTTSREFSGCAPRSRGRRYCTDYWAAVLCFPPLLRTLRSVVETLCRSSSRPRRSSRNRPSTLRRRRLLCQMAVCWIAFPPSLRRSPRRKACSEGWPLTDRRRNLSTLCHRSEPKSVLTAYPASRR